MKEIMGLLLLLVALLAAVVYQDTSFADACRAHKGTPDTSGYNQVCYAPGVAIDVN